MECMYNVVRQPEFLKSLVIKETTLHQLELVKQQAEQLMRQWPDCNMHVPKMC